MYALSCSKLPGALPLYPSAAVTRHPTSSLLRPRRCQVRAASSTTKQQLERRAVVSSFLYKFTQENGQKKAKVALFKRSTQVRTYRQRWAVISGSIEPDDPSPLAAAWREICEETTLTPSSLELLRQGKSYSLPDESIGREWIITPFAFRLKDVSEGGKGEAGIILDHEHETWAWYDPMDIEDSESFGAVPRLAESLRRVWFEKDLGLAAGAVLTEGLNKLKHDHESTAHQSSVFSLRILRNIMLELDAQQPVDEWWTKVKFAAWHIWKNGKETLCVPILYALLAVLKSMEERLQETKKDAADNSANASRNVLVRELDDHIASAGQDAACSRVGSALVSFLRIHFAAQEGSGQPLKVLTVSNNAMLTNALRHIVSDTEFLLDLRVPEQCSSFEGMSLAESLLQQLDPSQAISKSDAKEHEHLDRGAVFKLNMTTYTDASLAAASEGVDVILLGADALIESGAVHHKTEAIPAILRARHASRKAKTVVLGEIAKVAHSKVVGVCITRDGDPADLTSTWQAGSAGLDRSVAGTVAYSRGGINATIRHPKHGRTTGLVDVRNALMEWIPSDLVDIYVLENGILTVEDIRDLAEAFAQEEERLFRHI
ncbi:hypothetical protein BD289DRAFT_437063 [Coniella lustricola]|uniref:Nudix hydrolase domain-containing protein n=1 Tax=Coniella lustricola TaxID=2025994 RepID=A0A2T3A4I8_9PEZI|nr:hypothetical protein BD289DRAFT_437063 [Coniella lustricola]